MENFIELYKRTQSSWDNFNVNEADIHKLIDGNELIFFFKIGKELFGASEDGRMAFATMNDKDEEKKLKDEIRVHAINLTRSMSGEKTESSLSKDQMSKVKILDREEVEKMLHKASKSS